MHPRIRDTLPHSHPFPQGSCKPISISCFQRLVKNPPPPPPSLSLSLSLSLASRSPRAPSRPFALLPRPILLPLPLLSTVTLSTLKLPPAHLLALFQQNQSLKDHARLLSSLHVFCPLPSVHSRCSLTGSMRRWAAEEKRTGRHRACSTATGLHQRPPGSAGSTTGTSRFCTTTAGARAICHAPSPQVPSLHARRLIGFMCAAICPSAQRVPRRGDSDVSSSGAAAAAAAGLRAPPASWSPCRSAAACQTPAASEDGAKGLQLRVFAHDEIYGRPGEGG